MRTFALAGNPNSGKTTLFNALTGSTAHVGNWPGVTVDKREGVYKGGKEHVAIVDLPGIYSLSPYTPEEVIARNFILNEHPDGIINIVDATNLERNLYLTTQLLEMDVPVIIALNMMDAVEKSGDMVDAATLESRIGVPVVPVSALKETGIKELMRRAEEMPRTRKGETCVREALSGPLAEAERYLSSLDGVNSPVFHAMKLIEGDELETGSKEARAVLADIQNKYGDDLEAKVADERYKYISANFSTAKQKGVRPAEAKRGRFFKNRRPADPNMTVSDRADRVLTHKIWSIPIFIVILFFVFHLTFSEDLFYINAIATAAGNPLPTMADLGHGATLGDSEIYSNFGIALAACFYDGAVFSPGVILTNLLNLVLNYIVYGIGLGVEAAGAAEWAASLINDGIVGGITAVLGFLPQILTLFLFFSILEDTGYMARVAFILDRIFRRFGLSGRAFMPMIMGFGCSLPQ